MAKFTKKGKKGLPAVSTASLPDIVFMLLFFFMLVTVIREDETKLKFDAPSASEINRVQHKHLVRYINIGPPLDALQDVLGSEPRIQLDDAFQPASKIREWVDLKRVDFADDEKSRMIVSLKVHNQTKMGLVSAVKQELRKASALRIIYATSERDRTGTEGVN